LYREHTVVQCSSLGRQPLHVLST